VDLHFFEQLFHFSIIHARDSFFVVKVLLLTSVWDELEPVLVERILILAARDILYNDID
jgi:hypothetical protein